MTQSQPPQHSRRLFFRQGGLALGTALAGSTAATWSFAADRNQAELARLQQQLATLEQQQALLHLAETLVHLMQQGDAQTLSRLLEPAAIITLHDERRPAGQPLLAWLQHYFDPERSGARLSAFVADNNTSVDTQSDDASVTVSGTLCLSTPATGHSSCEAMARSLGLAASETQMPARLQLGATRQRNGWRIDRLVLSTV